MNEEEKKAIEYLKTRLYGNEGCKYIDVAQEDLRIFINLVDRKEKDIEGWKKYCEEIEKEQTEMSNKNCELEFEVEKLQKENEELKEYNMTYERILGLADNRIYRKKYLEERRKEQPNLLYPDSDEIYRRYYELKEENEHLHREINRRIKLKIENEKIVDTQLKVLHELLDERIKVLKKFLSRKEE